MSTGSIAYFNKFYNILRVNKMGEHGGWKSKSLYWLKIYILQFSIFISCLRDLKTLTVKEEMCWARQMPTLPKKKQQKEKKLSSLPFRDLREKLRDFVFVPFLVLPFSQSPFLSIPFTTSTSCRSLLMDNERTRVEIGNKRKQNHRNWEIGKHFFIFLYILSRLSLFFLLYRQLLRCCVTVRRRVCV